MEKPTLIFEILSTFHTLKALWMHWFTLDAHEYTTAMTIHYLLVSFLYICKITKETKV